MALSPYQQLEQEFRRLHAFRGALSLLRWDAAVMMPRGSAEIRGEQLATIETELHTQLTSPKITRLLDRAQANAASLDDWRLANLAEMRRQRDHAIATPAALVARLARATAVAEVQWFEARKQNQFAVFAPHLEEVLHLVRDKAALLGQALGLAPYDALIDEFSPSLRSADIDQLFKAYQRRLPALVREAIAAQESRPVLPIVGKFAPGKQRALIAEVMKAFGFPFDQGRIDESNHPFTEGVAGDVRITTRLDSVNPFTGLLAALHETGHAIYSLGLPMAWRGQPVGEDRGMACEESQALLIEMIICRSRGFLRWLRPLLEKHFAVTGPEWELENLYRTVTRVERGSIRVDADEVTYLAHIMLRYELEQRLLAGSITVRELPDAWNAAAESRLGARPASDADGCLQDIHWAVGSFGYFPSYGVGAALAAQLHEALRRDLPELDAHIERGEFPLLVDWLRRKLHQHGSRYSLAELVKLATGKPLTANAALRYLEHKYLGEETTAPAAPNSVAA
jgi:carboxypeptidase Taq